MIDKDSYSTSASYGEYYKALTNYIYNGVTTTNFYSFDLEGTTLAPKITINAKKVIFNPPATIIIWTDGDKTVVKCSKNETFDPEKGIAMCTLKKLLTQKGYNSMRKEASKWIKERQVEG